LKLRCSCYARFSTDKQTPISIEDQVRNCREFAEAKGWAFLDDHVYGDEAVSGAGEDRDGLRQLLKAAKSQPRPFDAVLLDDTSRLSRNVGFGSRIREELQFAGVRIIAVSQGIDSQDEQSEVLFDIHSLVDSLYVKELGKKTHRGLEGLVLRGFHAGGNCYGYRNIRTEGGVKLEVVEGEAIVIRRIFDMAANSVSLKKIAKILNSGAVPPPRPRADRPRATWCPTAIHAMLRRELYVGRLIWNRSKFVKSPGTNKRVRRVRPRHEWKILNRSELRIISDELWERVQSRLAFAKRVYSRQGRDGLFNRSASSQYLFSGVIKCADCGGNLVITSGRSRRGHRRYGCSNHFYRGTCANGLQIRREWLEEKLLTGLCEAVLQPEAVKYAIEAVRQQIEEASRQSCRAVDEARQAEARIQGELDRLIAAVAERGHSAALLEAIEERENQLERIRNAACNSDSETRQVHPQEITDFVMSRLTRLPQLLNVDVMQARAELLRHVTEIRLVPQQTGEGADYVAEGEWDLLGNREEMERARHLSGVRARLVAGVGFEPTTSGL
jgi:site-specific DNA recombinase